MATVIDAKKKCIVSSVTLTLDSEEFAYLCTVLARTGGSPEKSLRGAADRLIKSLEASGIDYFAYARQHEIDSRAGGQGSIYFKDKP